MGILDTIADAVVGAFSNAAQKQQSQQPKQSGPLPIRGSPLSVTVELNGSGNGQVSIGPQRVREHWQLISAAVQVATQVKEATCSIYVGSTIGQATFFATTINGSTGDTCGFGGMDIQPGMQVWAVWSGGDANQTATLTITGTYTTG